MTPELWKRVESLFETASSLPLLERRRFLNRECQGNEELIAELNALLSQDLTQSDTIDCIVARAAGNIADTVAAIEGTMIGPNITLSAGMMPGQQCVTDPVVRIGDRCLIGKGSGIVGHFSIDIGNDVWTGHHVYITDQNHGYTDVTRPISQQSMPERAVSIGDGSWLGYGTVVLPGAQIGKHVTIGANAVVTGVIPDFSVAVGNPARVIRRYVEGEGWVSA